MSNVTEPASTALVRCGLRKLGPERCAQALAAFTPAIYNWKYCLLARAYGPTGAMAARMARIDAEAPYRIAARLLGLEPDEAYAIMTLFDSHYWRLWLRHEVEAVAAIAVKRSELCLTSPT